MEFLFLILLAALVWFLTSIRTRRSSQRERTTQQATTQEEGIESYCISVSSRGLYCLLKCESREPLISYIPPKLFHDSWKKFQIDTAQRSIGPITELDINQFCYEIGGCLGNSLALEPLLSGKLSFAGLVYPYRSVYVEENILALRVDKQGYSDLLNSPSTSTDSSAAANYNSLVSAWNGSGENKFHFIEAVIRDERGDCCQIGFYTRLNESQLRDQSSQLELSEGISYHSQESDETWATHRLLDIGQKSNRVKQAITELKKTTEELRYLISNANPESLIFAAKEQIESDYATAMDSLKKLEECEYSLSLKLKNIIDWINLPLKFKSKDQIAEEAINTDIYEEAKEKYEEVLELTKLYNLS